MSEQWKNCCMRIRQRWVFVLLGFFGLLTAYAIRLYLSITLTQMVVAHKPQNVTSTQVNETSSSVFKGGTFDWSEDTQGIILSSYFWGYSIAQIPSGLLAEKFGGKHTLGLGILAASILSILSPFALWWGGLYGFLGVRFLIGMFSGVMYPSVNVLLSNWIPPEEKSKAGNFIFSGAALGAVFASSVSGWILEHFSWPVVFYFYGVCGVFWYILFAIFCYDTPEEHPFARKEEVEFLKEKLKEHKHKKPPPAPWRYMLTSKPVWACIIATVGNAWGMMTLMNDLNKYLNSVLKFSVKSNGLLSSVPYFCNWAMSILFSCLADWLIETKKMSTGNTRKLGTTIASIGPAFFLLMATYAGTNRVIVVTMITIGTTLFGCGLPSVTVNVLDLSPNYAGVLMALKNNIGVGIGMFTANTVGLLAPNQTVEEWQLVFWIVAAALVISNVVFLVWASGEVQEWNDPEFLRKVNEEKVTREETESMLRVGDKCATTREA